MRYSIFGSTKAAEMDELITIHFGAKLNDLGFRKVGKRRWVRSRLPEIRDVFEFVGLGHHSLNPRWGFSLDFCPHFTRAGGLRWHNTERLARIDVVYDPIDYVDPLRKEFQSWLLSFVEPVRKTKKSAVAVANRSIPQALIWFDKVNALVSLVNVLENKRTEKVFRFGFDNYVQEPLALSLIYARIGESKRAQDLLTQYTSYLSIPREVIRELQSLLLAIGEDENV